MHKRAHQMGRFSPTLSRAFYSPDMISLWSLFYRSLQIISISDWLIHHHSSGKINGRQELSRGQSLCNIDCDCRAWSTISPTPPSTLQWEHCSLPIARPAQLLLARWTIGIIKATFYLLTPNPYLDENAFWVVCSLVSCSTDRQQTLYSCLRLKLLAFITSRLHSIRKNNPWFSLFVTNRQLLLTTRNHKQV